MAGSWQESWNGYTLMFKVDAGEVRRVGTTPIRFEATDKIGQLAADGYFRHRPEDHEDSSLGQWFDVVVLASLDIKEGHKRTGLGTAIVRSLAKTFPHALIVGENANEDAVAWHKNRLEKILPSRMLDVLAPEVRVTPGVALDPEEL